MQNFEKNLTRLIKLASIHIYNNACGIHDTQADIYEEEKKNLILLARNDSMAIKNRIGTLM